jgi:peptide/nickel transport system substrate-binding protein
MGAGAAVMALAGCSGGDDGGGSQTGATGDQSQGTPVRGGTLVTPGGDGGIFDPAIAIHGGTASSVFGVYDFLNMFDTDFKLVPAMADLPEQVDQTTFIYKIKPNVTWQNKPPLNGRQFTAEDAAFGLQRFGQPNPQFVFKDRYSAIDKYEVVDKLTLRLRLSRPFSPLLSAVAEESALMVAREMVETYGDRAISTDFDKAIGTGPWMGVSRKPEEELVFERNPTHFRTGQPYFDQYRLIFFADAAARQAAFASGQLDLLNAHWTGSWTDVDAVEPQVGKSNMITVPNPVTFGLATHFNTKVKPYDDARVRTALHLATDRDQILAVGGGSTPGRQSTVLGGPVATVLAPYGFSEQQLRSRPGYRSGKDREADLTEAKKLLQASGADLRSLPKMQVWTSASNIGQIFQQNWREIGFNVEIEELATADALAARAGRQTFSIMTLGQQGASDPDLLYNDLHTKGAQNYGDFSNPEIDALLEKGRSTFGTNERKAIYDQVQDKLLKELNPRVWFYWSNPVIAMRSYCKGFRPTPGITPGNVVISGMWFEGKKS